jgi:hypothetical protein
MKAFGLKIHSGRAHQFHMEFAFRKIYIALVHKLLAWVIRSRAKLFQLPNITLLMELNENFWA